MKRLVTDYKKVSTVGYSSLQKYKGWHSSGLLSELLKLYLPLRSMKAVEGRVGIISDQERPVLVRVRE